MGLTAGRMALVIVLWIVLGMFAGLAAWYLLTAVLSVASWMIESPTWRPYGWFQGTLAAVNRLATVVLGAFWLFLVMFMERDLRVAAREGRLSRRAGWYALFSGATMLGSVLLTSLLA